MWILHGLKLSRTCHCKPNMEASTDVMPAKFPEYVYAVRGERLGAWKLGRWSGSISHLKSRYRTYYGGIGIDLVVFQCVDSRTVETDMFRVLKPFHWCNELYELDVLPAFLEYGRQYLMDRVVSIRYLRMVDRLEQTIQAKQQVVQLKKQIIEMKRQAKNDKEEQERQAKADKQEREKEAKADRQKQERQAKVDRQELQLLML